MLIQVLHFRPGVNLPEVVVVKNELEKLQELVGGNLEAVSLPDGTDLYCNEDGVSLGLPLCAQIYGHFIAGPFFIARRDEGGETVSLTENDIMLWFEALEFLNHSASFVSRRNTDA